MNNLKKIGLTALAGSLVATSVAYAGALEATGSAEMKMTNNSQSAAGKTIGMGNSIYFTGSGETDGGLNVSLSFELDQGASDGTAGVYDNHSVSVGNDSLGTLTVHGHGGSNSAAALDTTAAGDFWDNTLGIGTATGGAGDTPQASASGNGLIVYSLPSMVDGLSVGVSSQLATTGGSASTAFGLTYAGVDGLSVKYAVADVVKGNTETANGDSTVLSLSYAYGPVTLAYSDMEYDVGTANADVDTTGMKITYTVSDELSISYAQETIDKEAATVDAEYEGITAAYTTGGMTISAGMYEADAASFSNNTNEDYDKWTLGASFAF